MRLTGEHYSAHQSTTYWTDLFVRHFLFQNDYEADRDDLLFFIRKGNPEQGSLSKHNKQHTTVEVSRCLDIGGLGLDTFLILNYSRCFDMTVASCLSATPTWTGKRRYTSIL